MKKNVLVLFALMVLIFGQGFAQTQQQRLHDHIYFLAADSLNGRHGGSPDAILAAQYIIDQYQGMGATMLKDLFWIGFKPAMGQENDYRNVVLVITGSDPKLKNEYIVLGAHYDHLGIRNGKVYNGADDNASGTAAVIETARNLLARKGEIKRSVILVCFDGEEQGLFGSKSMVDDIYEKPEYDQYRNIRLMMSIDMVGWLKQGKALRLTGAGTLKNSHKTLNVVADKTHTPISIHAFESSPVTATDTEPFAEHGIPTLAVTTGLKSPYHKPEDDADLIDYEGLDNVTNYLTELTISLANQDEVAPTGNVAFKHRQQLPAFEMGPIVGYSKNNLLLPDACLSTLAKGTGFQAGLSMRVNRLARQGFASKLGLQIDAYYDPATTAYPNVLSPFDSYCTLKQNSITVPVSLLMQTYISGIGFFVGGGGFYSYSLGAELDGTPTSLSPTQHAYGGQFSFGFRLLRFRLSGEWMWPFTPLYDASQATAPLIKNRFYRVTLGYYF